MSQRIFALARAHRKSRARSGRPARSIAAAGRRHPARRPRRRHRSAVLSLTMVAGWLNRNRLPGTGQVAPRQRAGALRQLNRPRPTLLVVDRSIACRPDVAEPEPREHREQQIPGQQPRPLTADADLPGPDPVISAHDGHGRRRTDQAEAGALRAIRIPFDGRARRTRDLVVAACLAAAVVGGIAFAASWISRSEPSTAVGPVVNDTGPTGATAALSFGHAVPPAIMSTGQAAAPTAGSEAGSVTPVTEGTARNDTADQPSGDGNSPLAPGTQPIRSVGASGAGSAAVGSVPDVSRTPSNSANDQPALISTTAAEPAVPSAPSIGSPSPGSQRIEVPPPVPATPTILSQTPASTAPATTAHATSPSGSTTPVSTSSSGPPSSSACSTNRPAHRFPGDRFRWPATSSATSAPPAC